MNNRTTNTLLFCIVILLAALTAMQGYQLFRDSQENKCRNSIMEETYQRVQQDRINALELKMETLLSTKASDLNKKVKNKRVKKHTLAKTVAAKSVDAAPLDLKATPAIKAPDLQTGPKQEQDTLATAGLANMDTAAATCGQVDLTGLGPLPVGQIPKGCTFKATTVTGVLNCN
jgi:hypothetical protein